MDTSIREKALDFAIRTSGPNEPVTSVFDRANKFLSFIDGSTDAELERREPAVPVKKSITPDYLICLEDGKRFKSLKRHLATTYNMTPTEYRKKWSLAADYPMTAANYSAQRTMLAKQMGLGRKAPLVPGA